MREDLRRLLLYKRSDDCDSLLFCSPPVRDSGLSVFRFHSLCVGEETEKSETSFCYLLSHCACSHPAAAAMRQLENTRHVSRRGTYFTYFVGKSAVRTLEEVEGGGGCEYEGEIGWQRLGSFTVSLSGS